MVDKTGDDDAGMAGALRPLSACVAGAGVMTLGVLQFLGQVWSAMPDPARQELLVTVRVAFIGFLVTLAALVLGWLGQRVGGAIWRTAITLFGLIAFAGSAFSVATGIGRALGNATSLVAGVVPPDGVLVFVAVTILALIGLTVALAILAVRHIIRRAEA
ncbi:MAG: hypothetical protein EAY70_03610 [Sphingomonadales bacterium]|nr:MAG: hypothetical protein EAY70_03610 [Sphingomonadales bacterium]